MRSITGNETIVDLFDIQIVLSGTLKQQTIFLKRGICTPEYHQEFNNWLRDTFGMKEVATLDKEEKKLYVGKKFWNYLLYNSNVDIQNDDWIKQNVNIIIQ